MVTVRSRCIAVSNQKGGVGKTVSCVNLGIGLAQEGKKVLLIDADPQGSLTISLGYEEPDEMEYSLATLMLNIVNDEKLNMEKTILHHKELIHLSRRLDRQDLVDLLTLKTAFKLLADLLEQMNIHLVIQETIHFQYISCSYDSIFTDSVV